MTNNIVATPTSPKNATKENPLVAIFLTIALPVAVLNQLTKRLGESGPLIALILALAFPIGYAIWDYLNRRHKSWMALLGVVNLLLTGGLALIKPEGIWFAVKEAAFPFVLGVGVLFSAFTEKPLMKMITYNLHVLDIKLIDERLRELGTESHFMAHLRRSTQYFALSFFISSFLNFILAFRIFVSIDPNLPNLEQSAILNDQIARMTWMGFVVIALPLMGFSMVVMWHLIRGIKRLTGLSFAQILPNEQPPSHS